MMRNLKNWLAVSTSAMILCFSYPSGNAQAQPQPRYTLDATGTQVIGIFNLSQDLDCPLAQTEGRVVSRQMAPDGRSIVGITFDSDRFGRSFINLDPVRLPADPLARSWIGRGLEELLKAGQRLRLGVRGCGASASTEFIDSVALANGRTVASPQPGTGWVYGNHPILGLSAYASVGNEAIGLACGFVGRDVSRGDPVSLRMTPGLFPNATRPPGPLMLLEGPGIVSPKPFRPVSGGYLEHRQEACDVADFQRADAVLLMPGKIESIETRGTAQITRIRQGDRLVTMTNGQGVANLSDVVRIPATGAKRAIQQLISACAAIRDSLKCGD